MPPEPVGVVSPAARTAWAMLVNEADPMPPGVCVDWLRQEMGTDDVGAVKLALYRAAASECGDLLKLLGIDTNWRRHETCTADAIAWLWEGDIDSAEEAVDFVSREMDDPHNISAWGRLFDSALAICRAIAAA